MWRAGLSVAQACEDNLKAIHAISKNHPQYDPTETEDKAFATQGPYKCITFEQLNPTGCDGCPNKGKITSPIQLGVEILSSQIDLSAATATYVGTAIPPYPEPYYRGRNGGVYQKSGDPDVEDILVYEYDIYVTNRVFDPSFGECILVKTHLPKDGEREFLLPLSSMMSTDKFRDALSQNGIIAVGKGQQNILMYMVKWVKYMQAMKSAEMSYAQFGWGEKMERFLAGRQEFREDGLIYNSPPSMVTAPICGHFRKEGTLEAWKSVVNAYGEEGMEGHAFGFFTAFGAPLMKMLGLNGGIVNLYSSSSGTGKSTVLYAANSIWGHPTDLNVQFTSTANAVMNRLGVMKNIHMAMDEITNMDDDAFAAFAYAVTQGRGKERLQGQHNIERANNSTWSTICLSTSNKSFHDSMASLRSGAFAETVRVLEIPISQSNIDKERADDIFSPLGYNYGHAGEVYMQFIMTHKTQVMDLLRQIHRSIDKDVNFHNFERFWSGMSAAIMTGGIIAQQCGLHNIDIQKVYVWLISYLRTMRKSAVDANKKEYKEHLGNFLRESIHNMLVINGNKDLAGLYQMPIREPKLGLHVRFEPDTNTIYIHKGTLREWCVKQRVGSKDMFKDLKDKGIIIDEKRIDMSRGMEVKSPATLAVIINSNHPDFSYVVTPQNPAITNEETK